MLAHARAKLHRKGVDLLVVNAVGDGVAFEVENNAGWLLSSDGSETLIPLGAKSALAATLWDNVLVAVRR